MVPTWNLVLKAIGYIFDRIGSTLRSQNEWRSVIDPLLNAMPNLEHSHFLSSFH